MAEPTILMNVRTVVTEVDGRCEIRTFKDGVLVDDAHFTDLARDEVGDALVDATMACAVVHGLDAPDELLNPPDARPSAKRSAALHKLAHDIYVKDSDLDVRGEAVEVEGQTFYITITTERPRG